MGRTSGRAALVLTDKQRSRLSELAASRTAAVREAERAGVLLKYAQGVSISEIQRQLGVSRPMIYKCIDKALAAGVQAGLKDAYHRPHALEITEDAKAWVVSVACTKPREFGLAAELWSISALARHVAEQAAASGFPRLAGAGKSTVWRILDANQLKPHKIGCMNIFETPRPRRQISHRLRRDVGGVIVEDDTDNGLRRVVRID